MDSAAISLAQVTLQHDIQNISNDVKDGTSHGEDVWISCYQSDKPPVHGFATIARVDGNVSVSAKEGSLVDLIKSGNHTYVASCESTGISKVTLRTPLRVFDNPHATQSLITAFDIAPNQSKFAIGRRDGSISVYSTSSSAPPSAPAPVLHLSTVLSLRFFPSSEVLLSSSSDFTVNIISTADLTVARSLKGHIKGVTDTAIVEKGRNVLSGSKDGTVRLWDVSAGKQIRMMDVDSYSPVNKLALGENPAPSPNRMDLSSDNGNPAEVGTSDKVLFCGLQNGRFAAIDLRTKAPTYTSPKPTAPKSSIQSIAHTSSFLAVGRVNGLATLYDTRDLSTPLSSFTRNGASIEDLVFVPPSPNSSSAPDLILGTEDGLPFRVSFTPGEGKPTVKEELVGYDCDPVRVVKWAGDSAWTAGDDGVVRKYGFDP